MDPRTGLGRFHNFTISNIELMKNLSQACLVKPIDEILAISDVKERLDVYYTQDKLFREMITQYAVVKDNVLILDMRGVETIYAGNRFLIYTMYPEQNISVWVVGGKEKLNAVITVGYSIINRSATVDVGSLLLKYGGGGHHQVGTCQVPSAEADRILAEITEKLLD
jgi:nanoRNase/pAp phosphatase (c-di-AMP/oligoRNAs hydrolase)